MNSPTKEQKKTTQTKQECVETNDTARVGTGFSVTIPSDVSLQGVVPSPHQQTFQPGMVDPLSLRCHSPCQSTHCQTTYSNYHPEPQVTPYQLLTYPVPGPLNSGHHSSVSAPWFTIHEPIFCNMMPENLHTPVADFCVAQPMDHQQVQEELTEVTSHITQHVVRNVSEGGQDMLLNPCEPGPVFLTLEAAAADRDCSGPVKDVNLVGIPSQLPQYQQGAFHLYAPRDQTANMQPQPPPERAAGTVCGLRKPCHCTRSQCLKFYCACFASGVMCSNCNCSDCHNNEEHEMDHQKAIKSYLGRNPDAFKSKIAYGNSEQVKSCHNKGCNCHRSGCLKNYCECYQASIMCSSRCKCVGCRNYDNGSENGLGEKTGKSPVSVITPAVVESVCGCLLAQAEKAESTVQAERMILDEFGHCLTKIVKAMFK